jgi:hypothetical protein
MLSSKALFICLMLKVTEMAMINATNMITETSKGIIVNGVPRLMTEP